MVNGFRLGPSPRGEHRPCSSTGSRPVEGKEGRVVQGGAEMRKIHEAPDRLRSEQVTVHAPAAGEPEFLALAGCPSWFHTCIAVSPTLSKESLLGQIWSS